MLAPQQPKLTAQESGYIMCVTLTKKSVYSQARDWPLWEGRQAAMLLPGQEQELQVLGPPGQLEVLPLLHDVWAIWLLWPSPVWRRKGLSVLSFPPWISILEETRPTPR